MKRCVFLGPSLPLTEAQEICDAVYLPPIQQGDLLQALGDHAPEMVLIVDGYFEQVPAVWHKEILWALRQGVTVAGAASMGALRAAELRQFGMIGLGKIFEAYRCGCFAPFEGELFEDDDEVAVVHGPAELDYVGSLAMVDLRATLAAAEEKGIIGRHCRDHLARCGKGIFYKLRDYDAVLTAAGEAGEFSEELKNFSSWIIDGKVGQKKMDALAALRWLATAEPVKEVPGFRFEHTTAWEAALKGLALDRARPD